MKHGRRDAALTLYWQRVPPVGGRPTISSRLKAAATAHLMMAMSSFLSMRCGYGMPKNVKTCGERDSL